MKKLTAFSLSCAALLSCSPTATRTNLVWDFFKNPDSRAYKLSSNGAMISCLKPWGDLRRLNIFVRPAAGGQEKCITAETNRDITDYFWKGDDRIVYSVDPDGTWNFRLRSTDLNGQVTPFLTPLGYCATLLNVMENFPEEILIQLSPPGRLADVCRLNVVNGAIQLVVPNPGDVRGWIA